MRKRLILSLCLTLFTSTTVSAIEPIGSIGGGFLGQARFLPDGTVLGTMRGGIGIIDIDTDNVLMHFAQDSDGIRHLSVNPDGQKAVVWRNMIGREDMVELWDITAQKKLRQWSLAGPRQWSGQPFDAVFSPTEPIVAIHNGEDNIILWNWETDEILREFTEGRMPIESCYSRSYTRSGEDWQNTSYTTTTATGTNAGNSSSASGSWSDSGEARHSRSCRNLAPFILSMAFSPDGRFLVVGSKRPDAEIWDMETLQLVGHLKGQGGWFSDVCYSPNGRWIASTKPDSTKVYLWNAQTRQLVREWHSGQPNPDADTFQLSFSSDSQRLYAITKEDYPAYDHNWSDHVRVWDVQTGEQLHEFKPEPVALEAVSISLDESRAILQYRDGITVLWDMVQNRRLRLWVDFFHGTDGLRLSPDGKSLIKVLNSVIKIWDIPSRSLRTVIFQGEQNHSMTLAISPDSQTFAVGLHGSGIEIRDLYTGELEVFIPHVSPLSNCAFNQAGNRIAAYIYPLWTDIDKPAITIVDLDNPQNQEHLSTSDGISSSQIHKIAFSDDDRYLAVGSGKYQIDDRYLAVGSGKYQIDLWQKIEGKYAYHTRLSSNIPLNRYSFHSSLEFGRTPDDKLILVIGGYRQVAAWQIGNEIKSLFLLDARGPARFSSDGRYLFFNREEQLQIWDWHEKKGIVHDALPEYLAVSRDASVLLTLDYETGRSLIWDGQSLLPLELSLSYDINRDGVVNILDVVHSASQFGQIGANLTGDVNGDGRVNVSDLGHIGSHLSGNAAAPALSIDDSNLVVSYHSSAVTRQFQALAALESLSYPSRGVDIARDLLKVWLFHIKPSVTETRLLPNYPNPFNPETWIPYELAESAHVRVRIYDTTGHLVRELDLGTKLANSYISREQAAYWDGRNDIGEEVSSGIYFYTLEAGNYRTTRRMVVIR